MTATTKNGVKCGNCKDYHDNAAAVRACYFGPNIVADGPPITDLVSDRQEREGVRLSRQINEGWDGRNTASSPLRHGKPQTVPATDKQVAFLTTLLTEREHGWDAEKVLAGVRTSKAATSDLIAKLLELPKVAKPSTAVSGGPDSNTVPTGYYATPSATGNNDLDFWRVSKGTGKWAGRTFVQRVIGGHPEQAVRGSEAQKAFQAILDAGVEQAAQRYGQEIGQCYRCNRTLTDEESRRAGIGPVCRNGE